MKLQLPVLVSLAAMVPIGIAWADHSDAETPVPVMSDPQTAQLVALGHKVLDGVSRAGQQLATAIQTAHNDEDLVLATCLEGQLGELQQLRERGSSQMSTLERATTANDARYPYVVITVLGQKATLVVEEASRCVGANEQEVTLAASDLPPPTDPATMRDAQFDVGSPSPSSATPAAPPPPFRAATTTTDFATDDMPMDMLPVPPVASPVR